MGPMERTVLQLLYFFQLESDSGVDEIGFKVIPFFNLSCGSSEFSGYSPERVPILHLVPSVWI